MVGCAALYPPYSPNATYNAATVFLAEQVVLIMSEPDSFLYLSATTLDGLGITTHEVIASLEHLIRGSVEAKVFSAPKSAVLPPDGRYMMSTLSAADDPPFMSVKAVVLNPRNSARGLPAINSLITLLDSDTGAPVAIIDGNWVTAVRTAGASALAAKHMANADASIMAFVGCGVQGHSHLRAFADLFPLKEIRALSRGSAGRDALCGAAEQMGLGAIASATAEDALAGADIVITSTPLTDKIEPFLDARWLKPGAFMSALDTGRPWITESLSAFDRIIIDDLLQEAAMPTPMVAPDLVHGDLSGLVTGSIAGRDSADDRTAFVFRAVPLGDLGLAALAYQKAAATSQGKPIGD